MRKNVRFPSKFISFFFTILAPVLTSPVFGAPIASHDLGLLANFGARIAQVFSSANHFAELAIR
jgi:hypothetical protein